MNKNRFKQLLESELGNVKPLIVEGIDEFPICVRYAGELKGNSKHFGKAHILVRKALESKTKDSKTGSYEKFDYLWDKDGELITTVADDHPDKDMAGRILNTQYYYCVCKNKKCIPKITNDPLPWGPVPHECTDKNPCK
jgi:hypothetical protein